MYSRDLMCLCGSGSCLYPKPAPANLIMVFHIRSVNVSYSQLVSFLQILDSVQGNSSCLQTLDPPLENEQYSAHAGCSILSSIICFKEAMKDVLVLLVLLHAQTIKVCSQPYQADSDGNCRNKTTEYLHDGLNLCCRKCPPGQRLTEECTATSDSVCQPCNTGQYMEAWNYAPNCFTCAKCRPHKGLKNSQECSTTTRSICACQSGKFCIMGFDDPHCTECRQYKSCQAGYGVSTPGTVNSDVKCESCPSGTFSNSASYTDRCRPHTSCYGRVVQKGTSVSDTVCDQQTSTKQPEPVLTTTSTTTSTAAEESTAPRRLQDSTESVSASTSEGDFSSATKSLQPTAESGRALAAVIAGVTGFLVLLIVLVLVFLCIQIRKKGNARLHPKVDANGNCESADKISQSYLGESQVTSFTAEAPEQQCLLEKGEASSDHSQSSSNTETLTGTDGYSSHESIGPLQPTLALDSPPSVLSEPQTLVSNVEPVLPPPSVPTQPSSQPTSPQIVSPVTTSPQFNVNITLHIGNGSCGPPSFLPTDLMQADCRLPFGEEESFSTPQQEAGKQSVMSVQESESYSI
ncbi:tumor necrosis factor receptor superfamily member 1B [Stegastes partitus]|nr:PREDICTED: tumor necrosis factor receptor superfamily member 1B [Stegastes partitus]